MKNIFTKSDLKSGYVVELRNEKLYMVMRCYQENFEKILVNEQGNWDDFGNYDKSLESTITHELDIMKVYGLSEYENGALTVSTEYRPLLWERKEVIEMTMEEVCKALGKKVKIVDGHKEES